MLNTKKIKTLLDKINWLSNSFEENNYASISALEKSLLKEKIIMLYDEIENIPTTIAQKKVETTIQKIESPKPSVVPAKVIPTDESKIEPESKKIEEQAEPVKTIEEKKHEFKSMPKVEVPELTKEEKFKRTEAFQKQIVGPKRDLREIIDLNKSFIFKAELFNQNNDLYNQFVSEMNQTRSEDNAKILLNTWQMKMNWNKEENKAYELLVKAVEKRFVPLI